MVLPTSDIALVGTSLLTRKYDAFPSIVAVSNVYNTLCKRYRFNVVPG